MQYQKYDRNTEITELHAALASPTSVVPAACEPDCRPSPSRLGPEATKPDGSSTGINVENASYAAWVPANMCKI